MYRELADVPAATDQAVELSEATYVQVSQTETLCALVTSQYRDPDSFTAMTEETGERH